MFEEGDTERMGIPALQVPEEDLTVIQCQKIVPGVNHRELIVDPVLPPVRLTIDRLDVEGVPVRIKDDGVRDVGGVQGRDESGQDRRLSERIILIRARALVIRKDGRITALDGAVEQGRGLPLDTHGSRPFHAGFGSRILALMPDHNRIGPPEERAEDVRGHPFGVHVLMEAPVEAAVRTLQADEIIDGGMLVVLPCGARGVLSCCDEGAGRPSGGSDIGRPP